MCSSHASNGGAVVKENSRAPGEERRGCYSASGTARTALFAARSDGTRLPESGGTPQADSRFIPDVDPPYAAPTLLLSCHLALTARCYAQSRRCCCFHPFVFLFCDVVPLPVVSAHGDFRPTLLLLP